MSRTGRLAFACFALVVVAWPLMLNSPGLPMFLKADEPAYLMMALSLGHDLDLELRPEDTARVFQEFPFVPVKNLIVMTVDGWETVSYGKPYVYSLFAAPLARLFGAHGVLLFNALLFLGMIVLGARYLAHTNESGLATLFSVAFFGLSLASVYLFWLQPEIFGMAAVTASLYLSFVPPAPGARLGRPGRALLAGAVLALAVFHKPMIVALCLPVLFGEVRSRRWKVAVAWCAGLVVALAIAVSGSLALTGSPTSYLGVKRQGVTLCEPGVVPIGPEGGAAPADVRPTGGAWSWIFRVPDIDPFELADNVGYFLWGRHTGLVLYLPFAALAVLLFLIHDRHDRRRWLLLAAITAVALFFIVFIPQNWQGGGGFVGNRYFVNVYPAFLFLVTRIAPRAVLALGCAFGGACFAPMLMAPFGPAEPEPTLQAHTRRAPFAFFPIEHSLREVPGYHKRSFDGLSVTGRKDVVRFQGDRLWIRAGSPVEVHLRTSAPVDRFAFQVQNQAPGNRIEVALRGDRAILDFGPSSKSQADTRTLELSPRGPSQVLHRNGQRAWIYELTVTADRGRPQIWTRRSPPPTCAQFAFNESREATFHLGAQLVPMAMDRDLTVDLFRVRWEQVESRRRVVAGQSFIVRARLVNSSEHSWGAGGAAVVKAAYHWLDERGVEVEHQGRRTDLPLPMGPGEAAEIAMEVVAPDRPGPYLLELEPVWEHVAWFTDRDPTASETIPIQVVKGAEED